MAPDHLAKWNTPLKWSAVTHPGLKRSNNEDCFLGSPETGLWLVADGMGGHEAGEVASAIVRDTLAELAQQPADFSLVDAIQAAHQAILTAADQGIGVAGMGSTVVAFSNQQKYYQVAWVGDSRAYLWTPAIAASGEPTNSTAGELVRLTRDHSYVQMLFTSGAISADEIESHPDKHIITQCLGIQEAAAVTVDSLQRHWQQHQWVLLCSDGLNDELSDAAIATILAANSNSLSAAEQLLAAALKSGGRDNITLAIIESPIGQQNSTISSQTDILQPLQKWLRWLFVAAVAIIAAVLFIF